MARPGGCACNKPSPPHRHLRFHGKDLTLREAAEETQSSSAPMVFKYFLVPHIGGNLAGTTAATWAISLE